MTQIWLPWTHVSFHFCFILCMLQEHHQGNHSLVIKDNVEMNNVVYMFNCRDSTLTVKGKLNSVFLDSCRKSSVVFDSLVSSVEFVNCQSVQMQVCHTKINFTFWQGAELLIVFLNQFIIWLYVCTHQYVQILIFKMVCWTILLYTVFCDYWLNLGNVFCRSFGVKSQLKYGSIWHGYRVKHWWSELELL